MLLRSALTAAADTRLSACARLCLLVGHAAVHHAGIAKNRAGIPCVPRESSLDLHGPLPRSRLVRPRRAARRDAAVAERLPRLCPCLAGKFPAASAHVHAQPVHASAARRMPCRPACARSTRIPVVHADQPRGDGDGQCAPDLDPRGPAGDAARPGAARCDYELSARRRGQRARHRLYQRLCCAVAEGWLQSDRGSNGVQGEPRRDTCRVQVADTPLRRSSGGP